MTENPYSPPQSDLTTGKQPDETERLAGRGQRLAAAILDGFISLIIVMPLMYVTGYLDRSTTGQVGIGEMALWSIGGFVLFLALHGWLLANRGQTIGKRLLGIRIVSAKDESLLPFGRLIGLRYVPIWLVGAIPVVNMLSLVDVLFIFRRDRRCVHDLIAGSKVIRDIAV